MTPSLHTFYTVTLFLALAALRLWVKRRHRIPRAYRKAVLCDVAEK